MSEGKKTRNDVKEEILKTAMDIIVEEGFDNLSMRKIAARMNMTATNLYNYYKNKGRICLELDRKGFATLHEMLLDAIKSEENDLDKIKSFIKAYIEFGTKNVHQFDMMFNRIRSPELKNFKGTENYNYAKKQTREALSNLETVNTIVRDYISSNPNLQGRNSTLLILFFWAELHGLISLYNSGIIDELRINSKDIISEIMKELIESFSTGEIQFKRKLKKKE